MSQKLREELEETEKAIELLEVQFAKVKVRFAAGEIAEGKYENEKDTFELGLASLQNEARKMKEHLARTASAEELLAKDWAKPILGILPSERAFNFYSDYGKYAGKSARSLEEFTEIVGAIEPVSLRYHLMRGDFQAWIRDLGDTELAAELDELRRLSLDDYELQRRLEKILRRRLELLRRKL